MAIQTSAGSTLQIGAALPTTKDAAGYGAVVWTNVGEVTDIGEFGAEYNLVTHTPVGDRRTRKLKGSFNNGSLQLQMARDVEDAGQEDLIAASKSDSSYAFCVTLQDGSKNYFTGMVMSYKTSVGSVDQITGATCTIEIDSEIVEA